MDKKLIVVAGAAGKLGRLVTAELLRHPGVHVRLLVRDPSKPDVATLASDRAELVAFDAAAATAQARAEVVRGAFAVISTLQGGPDVIVDAQLALLRAAKAAGARRFIPSDYSYNLFTLPEGVNLNTDWRRTLAMQAQPETTATFQTVHVMQGIFTDAYVLGFLGVLDAAQGIVRYWGDGSTPIDWTTWEDTARYIAAAAVDEGTLPERLFVSGERASILTFAQTWERVHGRTVTLDRRGSLEDLVAETKRQLAEQPQNMYAWLPLMYARGIFGGEALLGESHNAHFPSIRPESIAQAMARGAA